VVSNAAFLQGYPQICASFSLLGLPVLFFPAILFYVYPLTIFNLNYRTSLNFNSNGLAIFERVGTDRKGKGVSGSNGL